MPPVPCHCGLPYCDGVVGTKRTEQRHRQTVLLAARGQISGPFPEVPVEENYEEDLFDLDHPFAGSDEGPLEEDHPHGGSDDISEEEFPEEPSDESEAGSSEDDGPSVDQFCADIAHARASSQITWQAVEDVLTIVKKHYKYLPDIAALPNTRYRIEQSAYPSMGPGEGFELLDLCNKHDTLVGNGVVCPHRVGVGRGRAQVFTACGQGPDPRRQLLRMKLDDRITEMFAVPELAEAFDYRSTRKPGDGDIFDKCQRLNIPFGSVFLFLLAEVCEL